MIIYSKILFVLHTLTLIEPLPFLGKSTDVLLVSKPEN